jgi:hypothetical protein
VQMLEPVKVENQKEERDACTRFLVLFLGILLTHFAIHYTFRPVSHVGVDIIKHIGPAYF